MDLVRIAESIVSGPEVTAAANPEVAKAVANLVKTAVKPLLDKLKPDFGYDALDSGLRGMSEGSMSFPARPAVFDEANLNGTLLVKGVLNPPVQGSGKEIAGTATTVQFECGFFFKTPKAKGGGKYMFQTPAGQAGITFDASGQPQLTDAADLVDLVDALETLADRVLSEHPPEAKSLTRDPRLRKEQAELNETARKEKAEREREQAQSDSARAQKEADAATHGSVEAFVNYMDEQDEDHFGPADLQKLLNTMFNDPPTRAMSQVRIKQELEAEGMVFDPKKRHLSSRRQKLDLLRIASRVSAS